MLTMLGLKPWEPDESVPGLAPPAAEVGVGDAVAVPTVGPAVAVVESAVAPGKARLVSRPGEGASEREAAGGAPTAVGPALAVAAPAAGKKTGTTTTQPAPLPESSPPPLEAPPAAPAPELASTPATPPPSPPANTPNGPVAVGSPGSPLEEEPGEGEEEKGAEEEACTGDRYTLTITPLEAESDAVAIMLEHLAIDGGTETLALEGDLEDARRLVLRLSSEGGCVDVVFPGNGERVEESISTPPLASP